eukprot:c23990_g7_i1 orf=238-1110(+)
MAATMEIHMHSLTFKDPIDQGLQLNVSEKCQLPVQPRRLELLSNIEKGPSILEPYPALPSYEKLVQIVLNCRSSKSLVSARHAHLSICSSGLESFCSVGNHVVPMFVDCGSILDGQQAFNRLCDRNEHSWTSLISGYIQCGQMDYALSLYAEMQEDSVHPSPHTLMALLKACGGTRNVVGGQEVYAEIVRKGFEGALSIGTALVTFYAKCCLLFEAHEVFDKLPQRDVASWTSLVSGYTESGHAQEALDIFQQMKQEGGVPNAHTYTSVLKACSSLSAVEQGREIHKEIR